MCNLPGTHGNSCILYTIEQPVLQTIFVPVYNKLCQCTKCLLLRTIIIRWSMHTCLSWFVCEENLMHIHNSVLHKHALQASSPTGHCRSEDKNLFSAGNPVFKRGIVKLLVDYSTYVTIGHSYLTGMVAAFHY